MKKIQVVYPDHAERHDNVTETYRNAIRYMGVTRVRACGIMRNGINIVSTREEILDSSGKPESLTKEEHTSEGTCFICTQFETEAKCDILQNLNRTLHTNLNIELVDDTDYFDPRGTEGLLKVAEHKSRERNSKLRKVCIDIHGCVCKACGLDMEKMYGALGHGYVEVHHLVPISTTEGLHEVNAATDLVPLCPNCHAMIHRLPPDAMTVESLREHIKA